MEVFLGISAAEGTGIGTAFVIPDPVKLNISQQKINESEISNGWTRYENAVNSVIEKLEYRLTLLSKTSKKDSIQREVFETYILMLQDPVFTKELNDFYVKELYNIEYSVEYKSNEYASRLRQSGNEYLAERAQDICDVFRMVLEVMMNIHPFNINSVPDGAVVLATSLNSSDTIILSKRKIAGLALSEGGVASHVVILARNYGIPTIVGLENISKKVKTGETIILDTKNGELLVSPDKETIDEFKIKIKEENERKEFLKAFLNKEATTKDGVHFNLYANIGSPEEAEIAKQEGADGIGLFRTEFLYMAESSLDSIHAARSFDEESQFEAYKKVLEIMDGKPVTIRTLDAGGDKLINSVDLPKLEEKNPLMGLRAIRLSLQCPNVFKTQIRALLRASVYGNLKIMFPLISTVEQVKESLELVEEVKEQLRNENIPFKEDIPFGIMVETASAAISSDCLAKVSDFFSLGTNDLTQYTLAVDRENPYTSKLYNEFNLSVLRLIQLTLNEGEKHGIPVSVCGEMAGRHDSALVLAGMGFRNLSMSPKLILKTKELLSQFTIPELQAISDKHLNNL